MWSWKQRTQTVLETSLDTFTATIAT
jgi:hypothetical protein